MERLTEYDLDCGYYVDESFVDKVIYSNINNSRGIQGEAITKLAELENMIEEGELVQVVRCMDCMEWNESDTNKDAKMCDYWSVDYANRRYTHPSDFCSYGDRRK